MNVLFLTLLDFENIEEQGIYTDLLKEFVKDNHKLFIISPVERKKQQSTQIINKGNYKILKLKIGNIQKTNLFEKGLTTITLEQKYINGIKRYFADIKFDLVLYSTPPITFQRAVQYIKKRDNAKSYLLLKDIFPQNAVDLGILRKKGITGLLYYYFRQKERKLYKLSNYIGCMSPANVSYIIKNNPEIEVNKVEVCPNSIKPRDIKHDDNKKINIREKYGIPLNKTIFIYGGNLGKPQGIHFLIECLKANKNNKDSYFIIVGSGTEYKKIKLFLQDENLANVKLLSHLPKKEYELLANSCDVGLIFLDNRFTIPNFPSRILSYMQASMPVLAATDKNTDIGQIIVDGKFGFWCESSNIEDFNINVKKLCDSDLRKQLGLNARKYLEENYTAKHSYEIIMNHFNEEKR